jgi:hypothetical protein
MSFLDNSDGGGDAVSIDVKIANAGKDAPKQQRGGMDQLAASKEVTISSGWEDAQSEAEADANRVRNAFGHKKQGDN